MNHILSLNDLINFISERFRIHICITNLSNAKTNAAYSLNVKYLIHSSDFCNAAKTIPNGLRLCLYCKSLARIKAFREKEPFMGQCPFGNTEIVYPVIKNNRVIAILYLGMMTKNLQDTIRKIERTSTMLHGSPDKLISHARSLTLCDDPQFYMKLARAIGDYLKLLHETFPTYTPYRKEIDKIIEYINAFYDDSLELKDLSKQFGLNPKYLGRLFKQETGKTFHEYINDLRIQNARQLLRGTQIPIIEIAFECGYNDVTYFNRIFKSKTGMTPRDYRKKTT